MSSEIFINSTFNETRVAILEGSILQELYIERQNNRGIVGNIYMGKVIRVLPGMQAAFVDIGLPKAAFLHISDVRGAQTPLIVGESINSDENSSEEECITRFLTEGKKILVQVFKDQIGDKGARLTTKISFPARFLVFMPDLEKIGVSNRLDDENEISRLIKIVGSDCDSKGYIIRTAAEGATEEELYKDKKYLENLYKKIKKKISNAKAGDLIHEDLPLALRVLRDLGAEKIHKIKIDSKKCYRQAVDFAKHYVPHLNKKIFFYQEDKALFDLYGIEEEIKKILMRKVSLKSGGYLVIDQTEAMTTIDVNTGSFVGKNNLEETIYKTNLEATQSIARQLKLRNLGGIIILDFIDLENEKYWKNVIKSLETALANDPIKNKINSVSSLGLVEVTRKRTKESLTQILCETCHTCNGTGRLKTIQTVCSEIFRELLRSIRIYSAKSFLIIAAENIVGRMLDEDAIHVAEIETNMGVTVKFRVESQYTQEQFDVILV